MFQIVHCIITILTVHTTLKICLLNDTWAVNAKDRAVRPWHEYISSAVKG